MIVDLFFIDCPLQRLPGFQPETPAKKINMGFAKVNVFFFAKNCHCRLKMKELRSTAKYIYIY